MLLHTCTCVYTFTTFMNAVKLIISGHDTARIFTFNDLKLLEREPLSYFKCDGKIIFTRPFLMLGKVTFDDHGTGNALERYWKGDISYTFTKPKQCLMALFPKLRVV